MLNVLPLSFLVLELALSLSVTNNNASALYITQHKIQHWIAMFWIVQDLLVTTFETSSVAEEH